MLPLDTLHQSLLSKVESFEKIIAARAQEIETNKYLPQDIADSLAEAGLYQMLTPAVYGGHEVTAYTFVDIIERLAKTDASSAWCTFIACTSSLIAAYLAPNEARKIFQPFTTKAAGVYAPSGRAISCVDQGVSGYRVSGRWAWGSGSMNADIIIGGCLVFDNGVQETLPNGSPNVRLMIFDREQVNLLNNWRAFGLCGTGSGEFEVNNIFVPQNRSASLLTDKPLNTPLYKLPVFGLLGLGIAAVALGIAWHAIQLITLTAQRKKTHGSQRIMASRAPIQQAIAKCNARYRSGRAFVNESTIRAWTSAKNNDRIPIDQRCDIRLATTHAVNEALEIVNCMYALGGADGVFAASELQRCLRDINVVAQHLMVSDSTLELTGRLLLGQETDISTL